MEGVPIIDDKFTVTIDDGHGGVVETDVYVGADLAIEVTGTTDTETGVYSGGLNIPADDIGLLTYSPGAVAPNKGSVEIDESGNFIYTPTEEARRRRMRARTRPRRTRPTTSQHLRTSTNGRTITVATVSVTITSVASGNPPVL